MRAHYIEQQNGGIVVTPLNRHPLSGHAGIFKNIIKCNFPPSSRCFPYKILTEQINNYLNATSPLPFGLSPIAQICVITPIVQTSFARGEGGTRIDRYRPLAMPLVLQRKEQHSLAHLYLSSSSALIRSSPCDSKFRISKFRE